VGEYAIPGKTSRGNAFGPVGRLLQHCQNLGAEKSIVTGALPRGDDDAVATVIARECEREAACEDGLLLPRAQLPDRSDPN
jgi:hypothetical protein